MDKSILVKIIGFGATLIHGDFLVWDRWRWIKKYLPVTRNRETLIDIGCGGGAFTIGAARRGYASIGLSWDESVLSVAQERARICHTDASFTIIDVRKLDEFDELKNRFDVAICCEVVEHILNDRKLINDIAASLKCGGRLLLTTPYYYYKPMSNSDNGPFSKVEDGGHVRRGYTKSMLIELAESAGLKVDEINSCSGYFSQKCTSLLRVIRPFVLGWIIVLPLRILPVLFDKFVSKMFGWPDYSICMVAYKPRIILGV
jgi:SAM-dependent methyltransferase